MVLEFIVEFIYAHSLIGIILFALTMSLSIIFVTLMFTDKEKMKQLKERQKELQKRAREHQKNGNQEAFLEINKEIMEQMPEMLKHSMKPMFIIMIPIIIIFSWANANIAYIPIAPGQEFVNTVVFEKGLVGQVNISVPDKITLIDSETKTIEKNKVNWTMKGEEGEYLLTYEYGNKLFTHEVIITDGVKYVKPYKPSFFSIFSGEKIESVTLIDTNDKFIYMNLFGWKLGWLGSYIIFSIIFSITLRKLFGLQ